MKQIVSPQSVPETHYYPPGPIGEKFLVSDAFVKGIMGPIGSGKSTLCDMALIRNMRKQKPGPDGVRRRRTAIIRNTYGELSTTTQKTWHQWIPKTVGEWREKSPPTHHLMEFKNRQLISDWEVMFIALDRPDDVAKLLSMELSDAWINEAREVPKGILDGLTGRVGRYPAIRDGGCTDPMIVMDTNAPDTDHWWAKMADFPDPEMVAQNAELEEQLRAIGSLRPTQPLYEFFRQPGARTPEAENLKNLDPGYYLKATAQKSRQWIKVYIDSDYGFVIDGKPVYDEYHDNIHGERYFEPNRGLPIYVGIDFGLTPAAVFGQSSRTGGAWRILGELTTERMGALAFGKLLARTLRERYGNFKLAAITGDPAGNADAQSDETTCFQMLRVSGIEAHPASTNDFTIRREAVAAALTRMIDGEPGLMIHPNCQKLRKAMTGGYCYRRIQVAGQERYHDKPDKNEHSHVADALQYLMLGGGEARTVMRRDPATRPPRKAFADSDYDIFGR